MSPKLASFLLFCLIAGIYFVGVEPAYAETIRVPWPIWLLIGGFYLIVDFGVLLWRLLVGGFNAFWAFILFITVAPLNRLMLGIVVTLGGAFLPDNIFSDGKTVDKSAGKTAPQASTG